MRKGKYKWVILTNDRGSENRDVASGGYRAIDLAAPPFEVRGLVELPISDMERPVSSGEAGWIVQ
jgi:hypothetical protein